MMPTWADAFLVLFQSGQVVAAGVVCGVDFTVMTIRVPMPINARVPEWLRFVPHHNTVSRLFLSQLESYLALLTQFVPVTGLLSG